MYKVVVIDDEFFLRQSLIRSDFWDKLGFEVVGEAENGQEGFELIQEKLPHVALVDISMPVMNGLQLVKKLREVNNDIEVIIVSGYSEFEYAQKCISLRVSDYILKPINDEELKAILTTIRNRLDKQFDNIEFTSNTQQMVHTIKKMVKENIRNSDFKIDEIAKSLGYNYHYVCKFFQEQTNQTLGKYIVRKRMEEAKRIIENGETDIKVISMEVGYLDVVYFSKSFKKFYGITPVQFMKKYDVNDASEDM